MNSEQEQKYRDTLAKASVRIKELMARVNELNGSGKVAVVGIGCRFPGGGDSPENFWKILENGVDTVGEIPSDRWNVADWYDPDHSAPGKSYTSRGAFLKLDELKQFDASCFGISPLEAAALDPQQRLLLETACEALKHSGIELSSLRGSRTGVFMGMCSTDYAQGHVLSGDAAKISPFSLTGVLPSVAAGRLAYFLDITGPAIAVDSACSSSLVSLLLAAKSLLSRECDAALAGGVNLMLSPATHVALSRMNALSGDGFCRPFGDRADGYVRGEGCGVLYLKRLEDAEKEGLPILGVICGGAINHDGKSNGLTAPNAISQQDVIQRALAASGLVAEDIDCIEAHGTGTPLGDPIEARALAAVFAGKQELHLGSVKSNIGHLEAAAGVAGVIKALLMLHHGMIPASLHAEPPNRHIPWDSVPLRLTGENRPFPDPGRPRNVGVSSFGFSGTNAHLIVQEYRRPDGSVFPLSTQASCVFQRKPHWNDPLALYSRLNTELPVTTDGGEKTTPTQDGVLSAIIAMVTTVSGMEADSLDCDANLFELGLDSLMLIQLRDTINRDYGVTLELIHLMEEANTLNRLAAFVASRAVATPATAAAHVSPGQVVTRADSGFDGFFHSQLEQIRGLMQQQLEALRQGGGVPPADRRKINFRATILEDETGRLSSRQQDFLASLIARHTSRTPGSKELAQRHRRQMSDWINTLAYRGCLKEMVYPIASASSSGAHFTDIDGNRYLDLSMGFGVAFFGHAPECVNRAIRERLDRGMELATQLPEAGETAELFCRLTGMERVTFCNTGSEAVMMALRIARTVTGRDRIVIFAGSYHGTTDGVLAFSDDTGVVFPTTPGVTYGSISSVTVLPYGTEESLEKIRASAHDLAAILVEPVQSRRPGFQPVEFLRELRNIADRSGAALIFDEMITGFRTHPGGAQAIFGVRADIATYGKAVGGGMPVSIVAGKARYMDAVDGGFWQYGDDSRPEAEVMFFGGTFCRHPLAIASSLAALRHMEEQGPGLQEAVNRRTDRLASELNEFFVRERVPMLVQHFGSLFRFESYGQYALLLQPLEMDLFFYLLMNKGIYTWERRICFLSTAHNDGDIDRIVAAVKESIVELRAGGFEFQGVPPEEFLSKPHPHSNLSLEGEGIKTLSIDPPSDPFSSREEETILPMSSAQKRLYILSQYEEGEGPYHLSGATLVEGRLDPERLEACFNRLLKRHESLRTGFDLLDGEPVQVVRNEVPLSVTLLELPEEEAPRAIAGFIAPFDLACPPLLRILIVSTGAERHIIVLDSHHIALDGFSLNILISEFVTLYSGGSLKPAPMQYRSHVAAQLEYLTGKQRVVDQAFWLEYLSGELPVLDLPLDYPRPVRQSFSGDLILFNFDQQRTEFLKRAAASRGTTLYMLLLSAWVVLLSRLSRQNDLIVQTPAAGREGDESRGAVGMFAATLPLRFRIEPDEPFSAFLKRNTRDSFRCFQHQAYPFELLIEELGIKPDTSRNPLFDVSFVFEKADDRVLKLPGLTFTPWEIPRTTSMFDLTLEVIEQNGELRLSLEYATALFKRETMERWQEYYCRLLDAVCGEPDTTVGAIDFIPQAERSILQQGGLQRRTQPLGERTLLDLFSATVFAHSDAPALLWPAGDDLYSGIARMSYSELQTRINGTARLLAERYGVLPGALVGVLTGRSPHQLILLLAILRAGVAYVPVDISYPPERIRHIIADSGMDLLVTDREAPLPIKSLTMEILTATWDHCGVEPLDLRPTADSLAYIIYTSGSTGLPKGCQITHANLAHYLSWAAEEYLAGKPYGCFGFATPLSFDLTVTAIFTPLLNGSPVFVYPEGFEMDEILAHSLDPSSPIDCLKITPSHVSMMEHLGIVKTNVALAVVGGEQFTREQIRLLERMNPAMRIVNEYGPTETTVGCMIADVHGTDLRVAIGTPIIDMAMFVLDENLSPLPFGVKGELCIAGAGVGKGYHNQPGLTLEKFRPHPFIPGERIYRSGDVGFMGSDGQFHCLGRYDGQVKIRGYRIELGEIENVILELPGINEAVVIDRQLNGVREAVAFVTGVVEACSEIRGQIARRLPPYMIPAVIQRLERMPLTPNGKADRKALACLDLSPSPAPETPDSADLLTDTEQRIAAIWKQVLGVAHIKRDDNFFSLGGQSLKAMSVVGRLRKELGVPLKLRDFFSSPTVAGLAALAGSRGAGEGSLPVVIPRLPVSRSYPLSHGQKRFWLLDQTGKGAAAYNMSAAWMLEGPLDSAALKDTFQQVTARHESLRTSFVLHAGQPAQVVQPDAATDFRQQDLRLESGAEQLALELARKEGMTPFNLAKAPLLRVLLLRMPDRDDGGMRHVLSVTLHHIIADGWSVGILMREISTLYAGERPEALSVLPFQYRDYAAWHNRLVTGEAGAASRAWWLETLAGEIPPLQLPADFPRLEQSSGRGGSVPLQLGSELAGQVRQLVSERQTTLFTFLLASITLLLYARSGRTDIVVGAPVAGREHPDLENQIGLFLNTIALRNRISAEESFEQFLVKVRQGVEQAFAHQEYPFDLIVEQLGIKSEAGRNPLFDVLFVLQNTEPVSITLKKVDVSPFLEGALASKFDLMFDLVDDGEISGNIEYSADLYRPESAAGYGEDLKKLLQAIVADPSVPLSALDRMLAQAESDVARQLIDQAAADLSEDF